MFMRHLTLAGHCGRTPGCCQPSCLQVQSRAGSLLTADPNDHRRSRVAAGFNRPRGNRVSGKHFTHGSRSDAGYRVVVSRAPFNMHDVVQVVVTPFWHFLQAATH
jgi:hypothetical protein